MKILIKTSIIALLTLVLMPGCSYVSDAVEGAITERASFSIDASFDGSDVNISWDETDTSEGFAGIEIYRTSRPNDEYSKYDLVASRYVNSGGYALSSGNTTFYSYTPVGLYGTYFYRVGIIHWDKEKEKDRTPQNGYDGTTQENYQDHTDIDKISGFEAVTIY